jgi:hypothetical protein
VLPYEHKRHAVNLRAVFVRTARHRPEREAKPRATTQAVALGLAVLNFAPQIPQNAPCSTIHRWIDLEGFALVDHKAIQLSEAR